MALRSLGRRLAQHLAAPRDGYGHGPSSSPQLLAATLRRGDVLLVFSGSGNSANILSVCKTARSMGISVVGFGGRDGGASGGDARALGGERIAFGVEQVECRLLADADLVANTLEGDRRRARPIGGGLHEGA